jgi:hypothetical protein
VCIQLYISCEDEKKKNLLSHVFVVNIMVVCLSVLQYVGCMLLTGGGNESAAEGGRSEPYP